MVVLDILKRSWQWFVALAVVGGLWAGAAAIDKVWLFWRLLVVAIILGVGTVVVLKARQPIRRIWERIRKYPALEAEAQALREQLAEARRQVGEDRTRAAEEKRAALAQGRREASGVILAGGEPDSCAKECGEAR